MLVRLLHPVPLVLVFLLFAAGCPKPSSRSSGSPSTERQPAGADQAAPDGKPYGQATAGAVDPVERNGPIFAGWSPPALTLVITGQQWGYLEPCGCAGLDNQKGGLSRRHTFLKELAEKGWPLAALDVGGQIRRYGQQPQIKFQTTAEAFRKMDYAAVTLGPQELRLSAGDILAAVADADGNINRFLSANVDLFGLMPKWKVLDIANRKIGVTAVLGDAELRELSNSEVGFLSAAQALADVTSELKQQQCDLLVLLAHASLDEARRLADAFPEYRLVVAAGSADEPPLERVDLASGATLVEVGHKAMYAIALGFSDDLSQPPRYQRVPLDSRFADSPEMKQLMAGYQEQLEALGLAGLGVREMIHPRAAGPDDPLGRFAGAETCGKCHKSAYGIWSKTKHAHATDSLARLSPARQYDPECLSCHVTGWNPQEYHPYVGGFSGLGPTPHLAGNGCENCHGPGQAHAEAEVGKNLALREQLRQAMRLTRATAEESACAKCHDLDNSPQFNFSTYWPKVEHKGKK